MCHLAPADCTKMPEGEPIFKDSDVDDSRNDSGQPLATASSQCRLWLSGESGAGGLGEGLGLADIGNPSPRPNVDTGIVQSAAHCGVGLVGSG